MKKKILSIFLSIALIASMLVGCGGSSNTPAESDATEKSTEVAASTENSREDLRYGVLSVLNISEDEYMEINRVRQKALKIMTNDDSPLMKREVVFYDNLDTMQMALEAGDIDYMHIPKSTADYLIANNDKMQIRDRVNGYEKLTEEEKRFIEEISNTGFAFMMSEDNKDLRDDFNDAIDDMKEDGTLDKLIKEYITDVIDGKEPEAVEFEDNGDETIKVAVTGDLPPMDYVAANGSFAGYNTAILAEIGKRLNKKIELKQVDSAARAINLSSKDVDVVFWTRVGMEETDEDDETLKKVKETLSESGYWTQLDKMDVPEGAMVTDPYFVDELVRVSLKK